MDAGPASSGPASPGLAGEAMAAGLPVVATCAGGPAEMVEHGRSGLLVARGAPLALAEAVGRLVRDPGRAMGQRARERALAFAWDRTVERLLEHYGVQDARQRLAHELRTTEAA